VKNILVDTAEIKVTAGKGGDGLVSFRREKYVPRGGPDGGDGGDGGDVFFVVDPNMATLMDFRARPNYKAANGEMGKKKNLKGSSGERMVIHVPVGTLVYEVGEKKNTLIGDLIEAGQELQIAKGGTGGRGNTSFKSAVNRVPKKATQGRLGESRQIKLEIKLIADIGLIGLPNAGKSTLINKLTNANAKVAPYPFTTIIPNLGVWDLAGQSVIVADIPGLIEGASAGKGLGDEFLRHVERTRFLIHVIDPLYGVDNSEKDLVASSLGSYDVIRKELADYGAGLEEKKEIVVINKTDVTEVNEAFEKIKEGFENRKVEVLGISAVTGNGLEELGGKVKKMLSEIPKAVSFSVEKPVKVYTIRDLPNKRMVFRN